MNHRAVSIIAAAVCAGLSSAFLAIAALYSNLDKPVVAWIYVGTACVWMLSAGIWVWSAKRGSGS